MIILKKILKRSLSVILSIIIAVSTMACLTTSVSAISYTGSASYMSGKYYKQLTNVSLTGNGATDIVNVAASQIGYKSGSSNNDLSGQTSSTSNVKYSEYGRVIGSNPNDWCAYFVSWCARQAGISTSVLPNFAGCTAAYNTTLPSAGCTMHRRTSGYIPKAGDIIFFGNASDDIYHVGIVKSATSSKVYYIDGNNTNTKPHSVADSSRSLNSTSIWGYATPNYAGSSGGSSSCTCSTSYAGNYTCTTANYPLNIRSEHNTSSYILGSIPSGATVSVSKANGNWAHVTYNGISGYASMEYLKKICSHSYSSYYETAHPHNIFKKCTTCGYQYYTGETYTVSSCSTCNPKHYVVTVWASEKGKGYQHNECPEIKNGTVGNRYYIWYKMYDKNSGELYSENKSFTATISIYNPDGSLLYSTNYNSSCANWISVVPQKTGSYKMNIKLSNGLSADLSRYFNVSSDGTISFDKSSMDLTIPTKPSDNVTITLTGNWPSGAKVYYDYDPGIISYTLANKTYTITGKKPGTTNFSVVVKDENGENLAATSCEITVKNSTYTVKYDANGGTGAPGIQTNTYGKVFVLSDIKPQKTGYIFSYWTTNPDGSGISVEPDSVYNLVQDMVFYAHYKPIEYIVVFDENGADGGTTSTSRHIYDKEQELPPNRLTKRGYTFLGWSEDPYATAPTYTDEAVVKNLSTTNGSVVTLYAVWKEGHYGDVNKDGAITFDDCLLLNKAITGNIEATPWITVMGDVNGDGDLTIVDMTLINNVRLGSNDSFPVDTMDKALKITTSAKKLQYFIGDTISTDGVAVSLYYPETTQVTYDVTSFCEFDVPSTNNVGNQSVYAYFNGMSTKYSITVTQPTITLSESSKTITKGNTATITATTYPSGQSITWSSSNTSVATVTNGKITAKTSGTATITAKFTYNGTTYSKTCTIAVTNPVHTHTSGNWIIDKNATCTSSGSKHKECTSCGEIVETVVIPASGHNSSNWIIDRNSTCTASGSKHKECTTCGATLETAVILSTGHNSSNWIIDRNATCTSSGSKHKECTVCGITVETATVPAKGHTSSDWIVDKDATTNAPGTKYKKCTACGTKLETATIPQLKPATPKVTSTNAIGGVQVNWNKIDGAVKYVIYRRGEKQTSYTQIGTTTSTTFLDKNVASGQYYCYTVRAFNSAGGYSDYIYANTSTRKYMETPKLTTIYNHQNGLAIKWNAVAGVTNGYRVYRRGAGSTSWTYLGTTKNLYFIDSAVKNRNGEYYRYTVIADGGYHSKFDTTGLYLRRLANPTLNSATSTSAGITVKWGKVAGSSGYYVYRKTANSTWTRVGVVSGVNNLSYLDKTAKKGTTYTYTVRAVYGSTLSSYYSGISCKDKY